MGFIRHRFYLETPVEAFKFLINTVGMGQAYAQKIVATYRLWVNGSACLQSNRLIRGDIEVILFSPESRGLFPIFVGNDYALFDKPSGLLVHPKTHDTPYSLLDEVRFHLGDAANIVHRIDKETSGLVLVSRHKESERRLKALFEHRLITKTYLAWVRGKIDNALLIDAPLKHNADFSQIKLKVVVDASGKPALTRIEPLFYDPIRNITLIKAFPKTGRQHQIRVHLFHVKHPILGDPIYSVDTQSAIRYLDRELGVDERVEKTGALRLMLHATELSFKHGTHRYHFKSKVDLFDEL